MHESIGSCSDSEVRAAGLHWAQDFAEHGINPNGFYTVSASLCVSTPDFAFEGRVTAGTWRMSRYRE